MNRPDAASEPSMEDILASIRKIIAEEPAAVHPVPEAKLKAAEPSASTAELGRLEPKAHDLKSSSDTSRPSAAAPVSAALSSPAPSFTVMSQQLQRVAPQAAQAIPQTAQATAQTGSLNLALNGMPGTPLGEVKQPIPLDDLADLLEDVPQSPLRPLARAAAPAPTRINEQTAPNVMASEPVASPVRMAPPVTGSFAELMRATTPAASPSVAAASPGPSFASLGATVPQARVSEPAGGSGAGNSTSGGWANAKPSPPVDTQANGKSDFGAFVPTRTPPPSGAAPTFGAGMMKASAIPEPAATQQRPAASMPAFGELRADARSSGAGATPAAVVAVPAATADASPRDSNPYRWSGAPADTRKTSDEMAEPVPAPATAPGPSSVAPAEQPASGYEVIAAMPNKAIEVVAKAKTVAVPAASDRPSDAASTSPSRIGFGVDAPLSSLLSPAQPNAVPTLSANSPIGAAPAPVTSLPDTPLPAAETPKSLSPVPSSPVSLVAVADTSDIDAIGAALPGIDDHAAVESTAAAQSALGALAAGLAASSKSFTTVGVPSVAASITAIPNITLIPEPPVAAFVAPVPAPEIDPVQKPELAQPAATSPDTAQKVSVAPAEAMPAVGHSMSALSAIPAAAPSEVPVAALAPAFVPPPVPAAAKAVAPAVATTVPGSHALHSPAQASEPLSVKPMAGTAPDADTTATTATLDDTVAELLRPMLRQWLSDNMPRIVEKALRIEVAQSVRPKPPSN